MSEFTPYQPETNAPALSRWGGRLRGLLSTLARPAEPTEIPSEGDASTVIPAPESHSASTPEPDDVAVAAALAVEAMSGTVPVAERAGALDESASEPAVVIKKSEAMGTPSEAMSAPAETAMKPERTGEQIGIFEVRDKSHVSREFAAYLTLEHGLHAKDHESSITPEDEGSLPIREATALEYSVVEALFKATYSASHASRFGAKINGVLMFGEGAGIEEDFTTDQWPSLGPSDEFPASSKLVGWHGTNASRAAEIMRHGFANNLARKSGMPMYGDGVYCAADSSKSMGYFHPGYYNDSARYKQGGVMFLVRPRLAGKEVFVSGDAPWGNRIRESDGQLVEDWHSKYDAVYALSKQDPGVGTRPNFREMCVGDPKDMEIVAAVWVELVPQNGDDYDRKNPVVFPPVFAESDSVEDLVPMAEATHVDEILEPEEEETSFTPLETALESLPYPDGTPRYLKKSILRKAGICESEDKDFPASGIELRRGDCVAFTLPESQRGRLLDQLVVLHRKDRQYNGSVRRNVLDKNGVMRAISDTEGAYSKIFVFDENSKSWVLWPDPYKRVTDENYGSKYAEPRPPHSPEVECLYDWLRAGKISPSHVVVMGWGKGYNAVTNFHGVEVGLFPPEGLASKKEFIFTPGTQFVSEGMNQPRYGGHAGEYPDSVQLSAYSAKHRALPEGCTLDSRGRLHITVSETMDLSRLEVSCGDTHEDGKTLGWAKLTAHAVLHSQDERSVSLMKRQNVPPSGVLKGSPNELLSLQPGDEVILSGEDDSNLFVMGVRFQ